MTKQNISEFRKRLDRTLASPALSNNESIKRLVKNQLLRSSSREIDESTVEMRTLEVSNFLEMLRSASGNDSETRMNNGISRKDWKLKQDSDQLRVMYREGPEGTPFHTLLAEGYVNGPIDVCLCVSWETALYKKWWPQFNVPPFKVTMSTCLQKMGIGEQISLIRVKVPWPVSAREALLHYFELEYDEDDLIIVLINAVPELEDIDLSTYGFSRSIIPEAKDITRVGFVGGFALQKVTSNKSYFRTIANLDIKLDFVPPTLINFVARQLVGSGFKLYQKIVADVASGDVEFNKILETEPMYIRIRKGLKSHDGEKKLEPLSNCKSDGIIADHMVKRTDLVIPETEPHNFVSEIMEDGTSPSSASERAMHSQVQDCLPLSDSCKGQECADPMKPTSISIREQEATQAHTPIIVQTYTDEVQGGEISANMKSEKNHRTGYGSPAHLITEKSRDSEAGFLSPEVEDALGILDKAIAHLKKNGHENNKKNCSSNRELLNSEIITKCSTISLRDGMVALRTDPMKMSSAQVNDSLFVHGISSNSSVDQASATGERNDHAAITIQEGTFDAADRFIHSSSVEARLPSKINDDQTPAVEDDGAVVTIDKQNGHENANGCINSKGRSMQKKREDGIGNTSRDLKNKYKQKMFYRRCCF